MLKNAVTLTAALVIIITLAGCNAAKSDANKYADFKATTDSMIATFDKFAADIDAAKDADGAAAAIETFVVEYGAELKSAAEIDAKYPELSDASTVPAELKETMDNVAGLATKLTDTLTKLTPYINEKVVQDALAKIQELPKQ